MVELEMYSESFLILGLNKLDFGGFPLQNTQNSKLKYKIPNDIAKKTFRLQYATQRVSVFLQALMFKHNFE